VCVDNAGGIRAPIARGPITVGDVLKALPFGNLIARKEVTGQQLWQALARSASLERPAGGFLQVSGLTMVIDGQELKSVTIGGKPLDREATYVLAAPQFLLEGGDGYDMLKGGAEPVYLGYTDNAIFIEMLKKRGTVSPGVDGRITIH